ncbi:hypothetical protein GCM10010461_16580 [Microbacterium aurantiacum]
MTVTGKSGKLSKMSVPSIPATARRPHRIPTDSKMATATSVKAMDRDERPAEERALHELGGEGIEEPGHEARPYR